MANIEHHSNDAILEALRAATWRGTAANEFVPIADYLDEAGDSERAHYVRLGDQIRILPEGNPQRIALEAERDAITASKRDEWLSESLSPEAYAWVQDQLEGRAGNSYGVDKRLNGNAYEQWLDMSRTGFMETLVIGDGDWPGPVIGEFFKSPIPPHEVRFESRAALDAEATFAMNSSRASYFTFDGIPQQDLAGLKHLRTLIIGATFNDASAESIAKTRQLTKLDILNLNPHEDGIYPYMKNMSQLSEESFSTMLRSPHLKRTEILMPKEKLKEFSAGITERLKKHNTEAHRIQQMEMGRDV